jgi:DNA-binding SARP family transcriptional activator
MDPLAQKAPIEISLLGRFEVRVGTSLLHLPTRKARALLAYLALAPGGLRDREKTQALLWPESGKLQAQASLRQALLVVRKGLSPHAVRAVHGSTTLVIDSSQVRVDVAVVEHCIAEGTRASLECLPSMCPGPLLDGFAIGEADFEQWVDCERAQLQERIVGALEKLADFQAKAGRVDQAIQTALHSLRLEPLRERSHRALMRLYAMHGRRAEAVQQYEACAVMLRRELGIEPEEQTKRLQRELLRGARSTDFASRTPEAAPPRLEIVRNEAAMGVIERAPEHAWAGSGGLVVLGRDGGFAKVR